MQSLKGKEEEGSPGFQVGRSADQESTEPVKKVPRNCEICNTDLTLDDYLGKLSGTCFVQKGYICPVCGYKSVKTYTKNRKIKYVRSYRCRAINSPAGACNS